MNSEYLFRFFWTTPIACVNSWARDWIWVAAGCSLRHSRNCYFVKVLVQENWKVIERQSLSAVPPKSAESWGGVLVLGRLSSWEPLPFALGVYVTCLWGGGLNCLLLSYTWINLCIFWSAILYSDIYGKEDSSWEAVLCLWKGIYTTICFSWGPNMSVPSAETGYYQAYSLGPGQVFRIRLLTSYLRFSIFWTFF